VVEERVEGVVVSSFREDEEFFRAYGMFFDDYVFHGHS
jgi:hypothetical protein